MQKQLSPHSSSDKYSISSRSGRKLYHRINENNIRVINKSKISSRSNKSIGSIALRRTELSNDKIYSREEDVLQLNSMEVGEGFDSGVEVHFEKRSGNATPQISSGNYRPRGIDSPSQRSLRSDSQKSSKYRPNPRKYNKNQIQKLFMLEANQPSSNEPEITSYQHKNKQHERSGGKRQKLLISIPRMLEEERKFHIQAQNESKIKSIKTFKSSNQSSIKLNSSRNAKEHGKYIFSAQENNQLSKLARKYKQILNENTSRDSRKREVHKDWYDDIKRQKSRDLQKYQSQKYLPQNLNEIQNRKSSHKRQIQQNKIRMDQKIRNSRQYQEKINQHYVADNRSRKDKICQNQLSKYQKDTWARTIHRKNHIEEKNHLNQKFYPYEQEIKRQEIKRFVEYDSSRIINNKSPRQYYKLSSRDNRSQLRPKHQKSDLYRQNIKIKEDQYGNLYESQENDSRIHQNNPRSKKYHNYPSHKSPHHRQIQKNHEYYHHITSPYKKLSPPYHTPETQISQTFDSLILSINSHVTSGITGQSSSTKATIDKINLHLSTLEIIADYAQEFRKMYEQIEDWEELIFLAYKKYWVERVKVIEYLKRFRIGKRHESERNLKHESSKKLKENNHKKIANINHFCSDIPRNNIDDPFADDSLIANPFIIPFCKVTEDEVKKLACTQEGGILLQKIEKDTTKTYQTLQEMYNLAISKSGNRINMLYCDNFSDDIFIMMLDEIEQLIPNLEEFKIFEATKIRLGKIVKSGILILYLNGKVIRNFSEIITFDECDNIGNKKKIKTFTTYDLYYEVFEKLVAE